MQNKRSPVIFVGHGSPMNAIEKNPFTEKWEALGRELPRPEAILCVSAHWYTDGSRTTDAEAPRMIYDMYGFPDPLYRIVYNAPGSPHFARLTADLISDEVQIDNRWGFDHGTWSVLCRMLPAADIPVFQLSVDRRADAQTIFRIGQELRPLRKEGVLILGSGNVVHNLARINWDMEGGYPWAEEFDSYIKTSILAGDFDNVVHYERAGESSRLAFYTPDHFAPLLYALGAVEAEDSVSVFNDDCVMGSMSMTGYLFQ